MAIPLHPDQLSLLSPTDLAGPTGLVRLEKLQAGARGCTRCELSKTRTRVVFGEGAWASPPIAFVGEAPGEQEDQEGRPFVGPSGELLDKLLAALHLPRSRVYILNTVCCRPPGNRVPFEEERLACASYLQGQLEAVQPRAIVALGKSAAYALLDSRENMRWLRGRWHSWRDKIPVRVTWHPAYVLRRDREDGGESRWQMWHDLTAVLERLDLPVPETHATHA